MYFFDCHNCGTEVKVTAQETQQHAATTCPKCAIEIVFANVELKEGRLTVVIRCSHPDCAYYEREQEALLTRSFLRQAVVPGGDDRVFCTSCRRTFKLTDLEKQNTCRMLEEEAAQEAIYSHAEIC